MRKFALAALSRVHIREPFERFAAVTDGPSFDGGILVDPTLNHSID